MLRTRIGPHSVTLLVARPESTRVLPSNTGPSFPLCNRIPCDAIPRSQFVSPPTHPVCQDRPDTPGKPDATFRMRADSRRKRADYNRRSGTGIFANPDSLGANHCYNESGALPAAALGLHFGRRHLQWILYWSTRSRTSVSIMSRMISLCSSGSRASG